MREFILALCLLFFLLLALLLDNADVANEKFKKNSNVEKVTKNRNIYLAICCIAIYMVIAFRNVSVGTDTIGYSEYFLSSTSLIFGKREYGFSLITYLIRQLTDNIHIYLGIMAIPFPLSLYFLIKNEKGNCVDAYISVVIMITIGLFTFAMAGMRQINAISLIIISYKYIIKEKTFKSIFFIIIATLFHISSIVFMLCFIFKKKRFGIINILLMVSLYIVTILNPAIIIKLLNYTFVKNVYGTYGSIYESAISYSMFVIQLLLFIVCRLCTKRKKLDDKFLITINIVFIGMCFQLLTPIIGEFFRIALYFSVFFCILVPNAINMCRTKTIVTVCKAGIISTILIYLIFINNPIANYYFM